MNTPTSNTPAPVTKALLIRAIRNAEEVLNFPEATDRRKLQLTDIQVGAMAEVIRDDIAMEHANRETDTPAPDLSTQPSPGALRAAQSLREDMERRSPAFRPSQHEWDTQTARMIDRETGTAELLATIDALLFRFDHTAEGSPEDAEALDAARAVFVKHSTRTS